jgi:TrmH family RNA methyltransferase
MPEAKIPDYPDENILVLDGIRDPGNLGTIVRTADWFGISEIICSDDCVDLFNPKTVQATMGSLFRVNVLYYDLPKAMQNLRRYHPLKPILGATLQGENVYRVILPEHAFVVMGSESHGIRPEVKKYVTKEIKIPQFGGGESLNVATAAAVLCSEFKRG